MGENARERVLLLFMTGEQWRVFWITMARLSPSHLAGSARLFFGEWREITITNTVRWYERWPWLWWWWWWRWWQCLSSSVISTYIKKKCVIDIDTRSCWWSVACLLPRTQNEFCFLIISLQWMLACTMSITSLFVDISDIDQVRRRLCRASECISDSYLIFHDLQPWKLFCRWFFLDYLLIMLA